MFFENGLVSIKFTTFSKITAKILVHYRLIFTYHRQSMYAICRYNLINLEKNRLKMFLS